MDLEKVRNLKLLVLEMGSIPQQDVIDLCDQTLHLATLVQELHERFEAYEKERCDCVMAFTGDIIERVAQKVEEHGRLVVSWEDYDDEVAREKANESNS